MTFFYIAFCLFVGSTANHHESIGWMPEPQNGIFGFTSMAGGMVALGDSLYHVFGFKRECFDGRVCNNTFYTGAEIFQYSFHAKEWNMVDVDVHFNESNMDIEMKMPGERTNFAITTYNSQNIIIYGGVKYDPFFANYQPYDDFWYFSLADNQWHEIIPNNNYSDYNDSNNVSPGFLSGASIVSNGDDLIYLFGGFSYATFGLTNNIFYYSFITNVWTLLEPINQTIKPLPRFGMKMYHDDIDNEIMIALGGIDAFQGIPSGDLWRYSIDENNWYQIIPNNDEEITGVERNVFAGSFDRSTGNIFVYFGDNEDNDNECITPYTVAAGQSVSNETFMYSKSSNEWIKLDNIFNILSPKLKRPSSVAYSLNGKLYVVGGFDFVCDDETRLIGAPVFNKQLYSLSLKKIYKRLNIQQTRSNSGSRSRSTSGSSDHE